MAIDLRGHTVPSGTDSPKRSDLNALSLSINATKTVANMVEAQQYLDALTAASLPTAGVTIFNQTDQKYYGRTGNAWAQIKTSADITRVAVPRHAQNTNGGQLWAEYDGHEVTVWGRVTFPTSTTLARDIGTLPASIPPASMDNGIVPGIANSTGNHTLVGRIKYGNVLEIVNRLENSIEGCYFWCKYFPA